MIDSFRLGLFVCALTATAIATEPMANHYFELRLYSVTSNKLGGVLERFRDTPESIQKSIAAFHQDPEWQRIEQETERDGKLRSGVKALIMLPTDFSSLK